MGMAVCQGVDEWSSDVLGIVFTSNPYIGTFLIVVLLNRIM